MVAALLLQCGLNGLEMKLLSYENLHPKKKCQKPFDWHLEKVKKTNLSLAVGVESWEPVGKARSLPVSSCHCLFQENSWIFPTGSRSSFQTVSQQRRPCQRSAVFMLCRSMGKLCGNRTLLLKKTSCPWLAYWAHRSHTQALSFT